MKLVADVNITPPYLKWQMMFYNIIEHASQSILREAKVIIRSLFSGGSICF